MGTKTVKFGGTSLCDGPHMKKAAQIVLADEKRTVVTVSAPGKRYKGDTKITDLLLLADAASCDAEKEACLSLVENRFQNMLTDLGLPDFLDREFTEMRTLHGDALISRGEYFTARIFASYLHYGFLDAASCIFLQEDGRVDEKKTDLILKEKIKRIGRVVVPGFYGKDERGEIRLLDRGGSDITGALCALAADAELYENFTDVDGFLFTDPCFMENPVTVPAMSYRELRLLAKNGATVLHADTVLPLMEREIPVVIRNTENPDGPYTVINGKRQEGIAGMAVSPASVISIQSKDGRDGHLEKAAAVFREFQLSFTAVEKEGDTHTFFFRTGHFPKAELLAITLQQQLDAEIVTVKENLVKITAVGEKIPREAEEVVFACIRPFPVLYAVFAPTRFSLYLGAEHAKKAVHALYEGLVAYRREFPPTP